MESGMIVKTNRRNTGLIRTLAERAASHPRIEQAVIGAVRMTLPGILEELVRELAAGEQLRIYVPKIKQEHRDERQARIKAALQQGEARSSIAKRENVSERYVRIIRDRMKKALGTVTP
jgi:DNA-binding NarL/FixJ family response regulator